MATNIVDKVIDKQDLKVMEAIAEKYDMSLVELGRFVAKIKNEKGVRPHVRFSVDELKIVDEKANVLNLSRSKYCRVAYQWFMQSEVYKKVNVLDFREENSGRTERVCVLFPNADEYMKMREHAKSFSIPFTTLIRYCALNYSENL